ncbi:MAG TPA: cytochrome c3 family protein [candidate division Zixibacteria bacterium]|nr:cytochrome c3 family protein [candidate division Zixibacteria bacterium]
MKANLMAFGLPGILFITFLFYSLPTSGANKNLYSNSPEDIEAGEMCKDCHDDYDSGLIGTAHASAMLPHKLEINCINCHSGAAVHIEDPKVDNIGSPEHMDAGGVLAVCTQCHQPHMQLDNTGFDPHLGEGLSCISCHSIHEGAEGLLQDDKMAFCGECHQTVVNQFARNSNHPLTDNAVSCISCHDFTGKIEPMFAHGASSNCASCHPMEGGPYLFEHDATSSFVTEGNGGCISCHMPHGSPNDKLLSRPNNMLCQQCHGTPPGHRNLPLGHATLNSDNCMDCHSELHGSNMNRWLLDPSLGAKVGSGPGTCFCHNVSG